ncbi:MULTISPECIES: rolling circle replication-associated protein, partial [Streptomyces]
STGEIREFEHSENRQENYNSLRQTFKKLRYLINNNFIGRPNELHITLTYKKNMTDTKKLYSDFQNFIDRLRYKYKKESSIDYLSVVEPQGRGAWHCHVLMRFNDLDKIYIKNAELRSLWGLGFVTIKSLKDIDNIGAYLSAYLTDIDLEDVQDRETALKVASEGCEVQTKIVEGREKKFLKGGRLHMYPSGMNMYRKSKGIVKPEREEMKFGDIKKVVGSAKPHYEKSYHVENDNFENTISFLQYNTKRDF